MFDFLKPTFYFNSIYEVPVDFFVKNGIKGILFDIDNTLEPYASEVPGEKCQKLFSDLHEAGIKTAIISNNHKDRVEKFATPLNSDFYFESLKPKTGNVFKAIEKMGLDKKDVVIIGDQLFTDIWAGSRAGIRSIFLDKISSVEGKFVKFKRMLEIPFVKRIRKCGYSKI